VVRKGRKEHPPLLAAGTGVDGALLWRLAAGRRGFGAIGCGKYGVGCRHAAKAAGSRGTAADKEWPCAGSECSAAEVRRHCRHKRHKNGGWDERGMGDLGHGELHGLTQKRNSIVEQKFNNVKV